MLWFLKLISRALPEEYEELVEVGMGGLAIKQLLDEINIEDLIVSIGEEIEKARGQRERNFLNV